MAQAHSLWGEGQGDKVETEAAAFRPVAHPVGLAGPEELSTARGRACDHVIVAESTWRALPRGDLEPVARFGAVVVARRMR